LAKPNRVPQNLFYVGFDEQASKETSVAPAYFPEYFDGDISFIPELNYEHYRPAGSQFQNMSLVQSIALSQSFTALGTPEIAGALLAYTFGDDAISGEADPYTHVITYEERADMPWFSLEVSAGYDAEQTDPVIARFADCRMASLALSAESGMPLMLAANIEAINIEKEASETAESFESDKPFIFYQGTYTLDSGAITNITNFNIEFTNILATDDYTDNVIRDDIPVIGREGTVSFTVKFDDGTRLWDTYMESGHAAVIEALNAGDFNVEFENDVTAAAEGYRALEIDIPNIDHVSASVSPGPGDGTLSYDCEAVIRQDKAQSEAFATATVTDGNDSAYVA
jgi:hypothetical protein